MEVYTTFIVPFDEEFIKKKYEKNTKHDFSIRITSARRNISAQTYKGYIFLYIFFVFSNGRKRFNRRNKSKYNARKMHSTEEEKYKIPSFVSISSWK